MASEKNDTSNSGFNYDDIPIGFYDKVARTGNPIRRCWHLEKFERIIECLPLHQSSILDIGCFAGTFLSLLSKDRYSRQVGVDILQKQVDYANENYATEFREFRCIPNINNLDTLDEKFDVVTLIEVIEHLEQREINILFEKISKLLNAGGRLVLSTPNQL